MAHNHGVALLGLLLLLGGALANHVVLEFLALDCHSRPVAGVCIKLEGCVDPRDNGGQPFIATTDSNGMAGFYRDPLVVQYCFGSARGLCSWSATKGGETYTADITTLVNQTGAPTPITPHTFAGCKCDGSDECEPVVHYPLIVLKRSGCPCPSTAPRHSPDDDDDDNEDEPHTLTIQPLLPPTQCPTTCSIDLTDGSTRTGACYASLPGAAGSRRLLGYGDVCPQGTLNSRQPCGGSAEHCGVCCVPYRIDFRHTHP